MPKILRTYRSLESVRSEANSLQKSSDSSMSETDALNKVAESYGFFSWKQVVTYLIHPEESQDFQYLACLIYFPYDHPRRRERARSMLESNPSLAHADIYSAATVGDVEAIKSLLDVNPDLINKRGGYFDWEPLLYACYSRLNLPNKSTFDVAKLLIERGANPDAHYMWGGQYRFTALTGAFGEGEMGPVNQPEHERGRDLAQLLLDAGADPNDGQGLYNRMFEPGQYWIEMMLEHGLNKFHKLNWLLEDGMNLVPSEETIFNYQLRWAIEHNHVERARLLIKAGADLDVPQHEHDTFYTLAIKAGELDLAEELARMGAARVDIPQVELFISKCLAGDVGGARDMLKESPDLVQRAEEEFGDTVGKAAGEGRLEGLMSFHELGFNLRNAPGQTPMHQAVLGGHTEVLQWLIDQGCECGLRDDEHGGTPLQWSVGLGRKSCEEILSKLDLDLFDSILCERVERIEMLVRQDPSSLERSLGEVRDSENTFEDDWMTPLAFAVSRNYVKSTRCLLELGANKLQTSPVGKPLLELAQKSASPEIFALLGDSD